METQASWLADGVKEIERITKAAQVVTPQIIGSIPGEKPGTYGIVTPAPSGQKNQIEIKVAGPGWHGERLEGPPELKAFILSMEKRGVKPDTGAVYVGETSIVYVYDFEDRRHRASCALVPSAPWKWLSVAQQPMDQRTIIRLLRITFDGCLTADSNLIGVLRNVKWKNDSTVEANLQRGKEALGRQILNEASGISNFPEEFAVTVKVFENFKQPVTVRLALELLPDVQKFELIPFPQQIHDAMSETLSWLRDDIASTKVPTFIGQV